MIRNVLPARACPMLSKVHAGRPRQMGVVATQLSGGAPHAATARHAASSPRSCRVTLPEVILMVSEPSAPFDTTTAHPARRYNYWLGGKENFAADRASADAIEQQFPSIRVAAVENRRFLQRAVRDLVKDEGVRQFLDIGTGLPTADNSHEVAQRLAPNSRIVCVDNDPLVLSHARALLTSDPAGRVSY